MGLFCKTVLFRVYNIDSKRGISVRNIQERMKRTRQHEEKPHALSKKSTHLSFTTQHTPQTHTYAVRNYEPCKTKMFPVNFSTMGEFISYFNLLLGLQCKIEEHLDLKTWTFCPILQFTAWFRSFVLNLLGHEVVFSSFRLQVLDYFPWAMCTRAALTSEMESDLVEGISILALQRAAIYSLFIHMQLI